VGVYHLMGLGLSPGAVTAPISYLAHRYQRWNSQDQDFFSRSGEAVQRENNEEVGDVQSLVIFTTKDVLQGSDTSDELFYVDNPIGRLTRNPKKYFNLPMQDELERLLKREWSNIRGKRRKREKGDIFWCEVDLRDIDSTYERIIQVVASLGDVGKRGKEVWINLTGGNNVINFALQLAATLSSEVARLYYVQAVNEDAEKCVKCTAHDDYWVDLPVIPLVLSPLIEEVIEILDKEPLHYDELYERLKNSRHWELLLGILSSETFDKKYLLPMWKPGLIKTIEKGVYAIGSQWELIQKYREKLEQAKNENRTLEKLSQEELWIEKHEIDLR